MANKKYEEADIQAIADVIRDKTGTEDTYKVSDMASGVNEVYEAGYDKALLAWWDSITQKGKRKSATRTFSGTAVGDIDGIEKMPYPLALTGQCDYLFYAYEGKNLLPKHLLDLSRINETYDNSNVIASMFHWWTSESTTKGVVPDYGIPAMSYYSSVYAKASAIETIEILRCHEKTQFSGTFAGTSHLKNITFEGVIGQNISFSSSPLTVESMKSIITHLKNYTGTTSEKAYTLTLKSSCVTELETAELTDEDKTWLSENGIVYSEGLTWVQVIDDLKWNLVTA